MADPYLRSRDFFVARITSNAPPPCVGSGSAGNGEGGVPHGFVEQIPSPSGCGYMDAPFGRSGSITTNPAYELNGKYVATGSLVFIRERGFGKIDGTGIVFDFVAPPGQEDEDGSGSGSGTTDSYIDVVIEVCLVSEGSGSGSGGEVVVTP